MERNDYAGWLQSRLRQRYDRFPDDRLPKDLLDLAQAAERAVARQTGREGA